MDSAELTAKVASMSPEQRYVRAREIATISTTRDLSHEERSEFVKYFFGPDADVADDHT